MRQKQWTDLVWFVLKRGEMFLIGWENVSKNLQWPDVFSKCYDFEHLNWSRNGLVRLDPRFYDHEYAGDISGNRGWTIEIFVHIRGGGLSIEKWDPKYSS